MRHFHGQFRERRAVVARVRRCDGRIRRPHSSRPIVSNATVWVPLVSVRRAEDDCFLLLSDLGSLDEGAGRRVLVVRYGATHPRRHAWAWCAALRRFDCA
jgi:hypothetical protein